MVCCCLAPRRVNQICGKCNGLTGTTRQCGGGWIKDHKRGCLGVFHAAGILAGVHYDIDLFPFLPLHIVIRHSVRLWTTFPLP